MGSDHVSVSQLVADQLVEMRKKIDQDEEASEPREYTAGERIYLSSAVALAVELASGAVAKVSAQVSTSEARLQVLEQRIAILERQLGK